MNFVPPVLIFLIYFEFVAKKTLCEETGSISILTTVTMVPLCIIAQLFSEHNTIFHVLFAGGVIIYGLVKTKKVKIADALALCSFAVGALIMFSNSAYHAAADNTDGYKQISFSLRTMLECYVDDMSDHLFLNNWILNGILVILLVTLLICKLKNRILTSELMLVLIGYEVYSIWHKVYPEWVFFGNEFYDDCIRAFLGILFWVHVVLSILLVVDESEKRK